MKLKDHFIFNANKFGNPIHKRSVQRIHEKNPIIPFFKTF